MHPSDLRKWEIDPLIQSRNYHKLHDKQNTGDKDNTAAPQPDKYADMMGSVTFKHPGFQCMTRNKWGKGVVNSLEC